MVVMYYRIVEVISGEEGSHSSMSPGLSSHLLRAYPLVSVPSKQQVFDSLIEHLALLTPFTCGRCWSYGLLTLASQIVQSSK